MSDLSCTTPKRMKDYDHLPVAELSERSRFVCCSEEHRILLLSVCTAFL